MRINTGAVKVNGTLAISNVFEGVQFVLYNDEVIGLFSGTVYFDVQAIFAFTHFHEKYHRYLKTKKAIA